MNLPARWLFPRLPVTARASLATTTRDTPAAGEEPLALVRQLGG